jgi:hypothetical protein
MKVEKFQLFMMNVHLVFASSFQNMKKVKRHRVDILADKHAKGDKCQKSFPTRTIEIIL